MGKAVICPRQGWAGSPCRAAGEPELHIPVTASAQGCIPHTQRHHHGFLVRIIFPISHAEMCDSPPSDQNKHKPYKLCRNQSWTGITPGVNQWDFLGSGDVLFLRFISIAWTVRSSASKVFVPQNTAPFHHLDLPDLCQAGQLFVSAQPPLKESLFSCWGSLKQWDFWFSTKRSTRWDVVLGYSVPLYPPNHTIDFGIFHWKKCIQNCQLSLLNRDAIQIPGKKILYNRFLKTEHYQ